MDQLLSPGLAGCSLHLRISFWQRDVGSVKLFAGTSSGLWLSSFALVKLLRSRWSQEDERMEDNMNMCEYSFNFIVLVLKFVLVSFSSGGIQQLAVKIPEHSTAHS